MHLAKKWAARLDDYAIDLAWSPDGGVLAAASSSGPIFLFSGASGTESHRLPGHENGTNRLGFAPGGGSSPLLATAGQDGAVKFWDAASGQPTATATLGSAWVEHLAWCPASASSPLVAAATGRKLSLLKPDGSRAHDFPAAPKTISALAWHPQARRLAVAFFGGVHLLNPDDFSLAQEFPYANGIHALAWSPDGKWLVSGNQDPSVHLWIPAEDIELQMSGYETKVKHLAFDSASRWLATAGGRDACLWDCAGAGPEGREPGMFPHEAPVCALAFQNAHGLLASASSAGEVQLWSPGRRQPLRATARMPEAVTKLAWSPDDRMLAIGSERGSIYVLDCEN